MIDNKYLQEIGLNEDQITLLRDRLDRESKYRKILGSEHVMHIEEIMKLTDIDSIDFDNEDLLRLKIRTEYDDMIPVYFKKGVSKVTL